MSVLNVGSIKAYFKQKFIENNGSMILYSEHFIGQWAEDHLEKKVILNLFKIKCGVRHYTEVYHTKGNLNYSKSKTLFMFFKVIAVFPQKIKI